MTPNLSARSRCRRATGSIVARFLIPIVAALLWSECGRAGNTDSSPVDTAVVAVEALLVSRGILIPFLEVTGSVSGTNEAMVISETEGIIRSVSFELGDSVRRGAVLLTVDRTVARLAMQQASQDLRTATMNLEAARKLYADSAASRSELANAQSAYHGAKAAHESALKRFRDTEIKAPIAGEVASKESGITVGNLLRPATPVARIVDLSRLKLEASVGAGDVGLVRERARAGVIVSTICPDTMKGQVDAVSAGADPATGSFAVVVSWSNSCSGRIRSGMAAAARIRTTQTDSVIIVPTAALSHRSDSTLALTAANGRVRMALVKTGRVAGNRTEVTGGLQEADTLLISRTATLAQGDTIAAHVVGASGIWQ